MTTKHSPLRVLRMQSNKIAELLKRSERGERLADVKFAEKIAEARGRDEIKIGIVMDGKTVFITLRWKTIRSSGEVVLADYILTLMRETRSTVH